MALAKLNYIEVQDYLAGEQNSEIKHEYVSGTVHAMAGASVNHNQITSNLSRQLGNQLEGQDCRPFSSDLLVKTGAESYRYPDVVVVCDDDFIENEYATATPVLIIEVLSRSTRQKDKEEKRHEYLNIPTLQEYVLIEQDFVDVGVFRRSNGWRPSHYYLGDEVFFESVGVALAVEVIYQRVRNDDVLRYLEQNE